MDPILPMISPTTSFLRPTYHSVRKHGTVSFQLSTIQYPIDSSSQDPQRKPVYLRSISTLFTALIKYLIFERIILLRSSQPFVSNHLFRPSIFFLFFFFYSFTLIQVNNSFPNDQKGKEIARVLLFFFFAFSNCSTKPGKRNLAKFRSESCNEEVCSEHTLGTLRLAHTPPAPCPTPNLFLITARDIYFLYERNITRPLPPREYCFPEYFSPRFHFLLDPRDSPVPSSPRNESKTFWKNDSYIRLDRILDSLD